MQTPLHTCGDRTQCPYCGSLVWSAEYDKNRHFHCCLDGKRIIPHAVFPKISHPLYDHPDLSYCSRHLNDLFAFTAIGTVPSRDNGGKGIDYTQYPACVHLHGKTYHFPVPAGRPGPSLFLIRDDANAERLSQS
jgi:hypothetical protein